MSDSSRCQLAFSFLEPPQNLEHAAFILVHSVEAITHAAVIERPLYVDDQRLIEEMTDLIVRYLASRDPPS